MKQEIEEQLIAMESIDVVKDWHSRLVRRSLNLRRAHEIVSAVRQGREYLRSASTAAQSVRPLLTYYGNLSISRATVLLLRRAAGEESLTRGHGLETEGWSDLLNTDLPASLARVGELKVNVTAGLFRDLLQETDNQICVHARSSKVDWDLKYLLPTERVQMSLLDVVSRLPDIASGIRGAAAETMSVPIDEMSFSAEVGFRAILRCDSVLPMLESYLAAGYGVTGDGMRLTLTCPAAKFESCLPQLSHCYVRKLFDSIPTLYLCRPISDKVRLSQIALTLGLSYMLGMLTRYFPTHWVALQSGSLGDHMWPTLFAAQRYVENSYPELLLELINFRLETATHTVAQ